MNKRRGYRWSPWVSSRGYTLIELMIAMTIGLILLLGIVTVFVNGSRTRDEVQRQSQQNDNGRYAMELITEDLHSAGYLGEFDPAPLPTPGTKPDPCLSDVASLKIALSQSIQGYDSPTTPPGCLADVKPGTDILVVRRVSSCALGEPGCDAAAASIPYFQAAACGSTAELQASTYTAFYALDTTTTTLTKHKNDCTTIAPIRRFRVHIYFIANNDKPGDGIPTLMRAELGAGGFQIVPLVEGIDNLQLEYAIDSGLLAGTGNNGAPNTYTADPDTVNACLVDVCQTYWRNVVSVKVNLLARTLTSSLGYTNTKSFTLGNTALGNANTFGPFNDGFRRNIYSATVRLNNVGGRNGT